MFPTLFNFPVLHQVVLCIGIFFAFLFFSSMILTVLYQLISRLFFPVYPDIKLKKINFIWIFIDKKCFSDDSIDLPFMDRDVIVLLVWVS